jgi:hypothetical protein
VKEYRRQRDKALRLLIFTSDRIRIILTPGILKAAKELLTYLKLEGKLKNNKNY